MELSQLHNSKLSLRALEPTDLEFLYTVENDPNVWEVSNTQVPYSKFILKQYLNNAHKDIYQVKQLRLVIQHNDSKETLGFVDLFDFDPQHGRVGMGILVYGEQNKRKGYASGAIELLKLYCFKSLNVHQVYANIGQDNLASINLFESCGFKLAGVKKDWNKVQHSFKDELIYQCIYE